MLLQKREHSLHHCCELYSLQENGLKMYDLIQGRGSTAEEGQKATVHFDCLWSGLDVVSSRSARLLGENRTLSEPFEFVVGQSLDSKAKMSDFSGGGLFSGMGGPQAPSSTFNFCKGNESRRQGLVLHALFCFQTCALCILPLVWKSFLFQPFISHHVNG